MKFGAAVEQVVDYAHPAADSGVITVAAGAFNLLISIEDPLLERVIRRHNRLAAARGREGHVVTASRYPPRSPNRRSSPLGLHCFG
jgi:hypothetical protein